MNPTILSGNLIVGNDVTFGQNVVVDVAEEVVIGNRCIIPDNAYFCGRRITIGNDFYGYSWEWKRLDIGRSRKDDEHAILTVGDRCTFHDNRIDLSCKVTIGHDVGLSPEVVIYTHGYWQSELDGYPCKYDTVEIGNYTIIGYRSVILAGSIVGAGIVVGAQSVVTGYLDPGCVYAGNPAVKKCNIYGISTVNQENIAIGIMADYNDTLRYRRINRVWKLEYPILTDEYVRLNLIEQEVEGTESEYSDDLRDYLFRHGIRIYTQRPFVRMRSRR